MSDLLKGLTGGTWAILFAWVFPSALMIGVFWLFLYPEISGQTLQHIGPLSVPDKTAIFIGVTLALGFLLNAVSTPLYRLLEGYTWPKDLQDSGTLKQRKRKEHIVRLIDGATSGQKWKLGLLQEKLARFPLNDDQIAPTRLGNALRAFETYGATRFNLDSQMLWTELCSVVPKYLQDELDRSRAIVDFFVALVYLSAVLGITSAVIGIYDGVNGVSAGIKLKFVSITGLAFASIFVWYNMAVASSSYWSTTVQALVNIGRVKLADKMGLQIPNTIDAEREMWGLVKRYVYYGYNATVARDLDKFRKIQSESDDGKDNAPDSEYVDEQYAE